MFQQQQYEQALELGGVGAHDDITSIASGGKRGASPLFSDDGNQDYDYIFLQKGVAYFVIGEGILTHS